MTTKLSELICSLKAFTVIIVEDDFTYEKDPQKILGKFCCAESTDQCNILKGLSKLDLQNLLLLLDNTVIQFNKIQHSDSSFRGMPASDHIKRYLEKIGEENILKNGILEELESAVQKDTNDSFKNLLLRHGIYGTKSEEHYQALIDELKAINDVQILYYNSRPSDTEMTELKTLLTKKPEIKNQFILAIVDNRLSTGSADEEGKIFIKDELLALNQSDDLKFLCCIYTSRDLDQKPAKKYEDYFIQEIQKGSENSIDSIAEYLAQAAYIEVFKSIEKNTQKSAKSAFNMVLKNQTNIKHIVGKSHEEGIPPYEAIKYWYSMALYSHFEQKELEDFLYYGNLTSFFNNTYLNDHPDFSKLSEELQKLNSFELFDYTINERHLPIAPGDIWQANGEYFILIGQLCDLLIRDSNTRKAKIGELIKMKVRPEQNDKEKFEIKSNKGIAQIHIDYFRCPDTGEYKKIIADISTANVYFADLCVLDLSMFNKNGDCKIDLSANLDESIKSILPKNNDEYFISLKNFYESITKFIKQLYYPSDISQIKQIFNGSVENEYSIKFSKMNFSDKDGVMDHSIKRVARLKDKYYDSLYKSYLNNKGRIDLNLIDNSPETPIRVNLKCSFSHDKDSEQEIEKITLWKSRTRECFFKKDELLKKTNRRFHKILNYFNDNDFNLGKNNKIEIKKEKDFYKLIFSYKLDGHDKWFAASKFRPNGLFKGPEIKEYLKLGIQVVGNGGKRKLGDTNISLEELKSGIEIFEKSEILKLNYGIIERTNY